MSTTSGELHYAWQDSIDQALDQTLRASGLNLEIFHEYMEFASIQEMVERDGITPRGNIRWIAKS